MAQEREQRPEFRGLAARLHDYLRAGPDGRPKECGVLVIRPARRHGRIHMRAPISPDALVRLVECIRQHVRHSDGIEMDGLGQAIGIVLYGVDRAGVRTVLERMRTLLETVGGDDGGTSEGMHLILGYGMCDLTRLTDGGTRVIRSAWRARAVVTTALAQLPPATTQLSIATASDLASRRRHTPRRLPRTRAPWPDPHQPRLLPLRAEAELDAEALRTEARTLGVPFVRIPARLPATCRRALPAELARALRAVPIGRTRGVLTVAMQEPCDSEKVLRLRGATGLTVFPVLASEPDIERALRQLAECPGV